MNFIYIAIGDELVAGHGSDTNGDLLQRFLEDKGLQLTQRLIIKDDEEAIAHGIIYAFHHTDWLVLSGGLGPTQDDVTREGIARAFQLPLILNPMLWEKLQKRYEKRDPKRLPLIKKQAYLPKGAQPYPHALGTAHPFKLTHQGKTLFALPGVPQEFSYSLSSIEKDLPKSPHKLFHAYFALLGYGEAEIEAKLASYYDVFRREGFTILAKPARIELHLKDKDPQRLQKKISHLKKLFPEALQSSQPVNLAEITLEALRKHRWSLGLAESCTGGALGKALTAIPGASQVFQGGIIAYSNEIKRELLRVPSKILQEHGAVSEPTALRMVQGVCRKLSADVGVSITGIAGPEGGTPEKPVGTVFIGVKTPQQEKVFRFLFSGNRETIRHQAVMHALACLIQACR